MSESDPVKDAVEALEKIAAIGRDGWERLREAIAESSEADEINEWIEFSD